MKNTAQDAHNDRMYELERERLAQDRKSQKQAERNRLMEEAQRSRQRQAEQQRQQQQLVSTCHSDNQVCKSGCRSGGSNIASCIYECSSSLNACLSRAY